MFGLLDGVSFWWWLIAALALGGAELMLFSYVLIWPALAAAAVGLWLVAAPATPGDWQVALFAAATLGLALGGRPLARRLRGRAAPTALNRRAARLVGRAGRVTGPGQATVDGDVWPARTADGAPLPAGAGVVVEAVEGGALVVRRA